LASSRSSAASSVDAEVEEGERGPGTANQPGLAQGCAPLSACCQERTGRVEPALAPPKLEPSDDLVRAKPGAVLVDLRGEDQLVGARARDKLLEPSPHGVGRANGRAGEDAIKHGGVLGGEALGVAGERWREAGRLA